MGRSTIKSIEPKMQQGRQRSFSSHGKTMYVYLCTLADGTHGEVNSYSEGTYPLAAGTQVSYEYAPSDDTRFPGKLKLKKDEDVAPSSHGPGHGPDGGSHRDASIVVLAVLKSIIESEADPKGWGRLLSHGLALHDEAVEMRLAPKKQEAPSAEAYDDAPF